MQFTRTKTLSETQFQQIDTLWNSSYPVPLKDRFGILLDGCSDYNHYVLEDELGRVAGWAVNFVISGENRFSIIVHPGYKGKGLGKQLIQRLRADHDELYGWVIDHNNDIKEDGTPYISPLPFYEQLGCTVLMDQRLDTELIKAVKVRL
jgi:GNAT superfamily N-acetyltransferase